MTTATPDTITRCPQCHAAAPYTHKMDCSDRRTIVAADVALLDAVADALTADGIMVTRQTQRHRGFSGVMVTARGADAVELRVRLARPATLPTGATWEADTDADRMVSRVARVLAGYEVRREGTGRMTAIVVTKGGGAT